MSDAAVHGLAGAGGGIIAQLVTYPLQTVNTLQQTEREVKASPQRTERARPETSTTLQRAFKVIRKDGWGGLYRGLPPSLVGTACSQGVYYYFYQSLRNIAEKRNRHNGSGVGVGSIGTLDALVIAAIAGCVNVLMTNPIWVIVTRMQTQSQVKRAPSVQGRGSSSIGTSTSVQAPGGELDLKIGVSGGSKMKAQAPPQGTFETVADLYREAGLFGFWKGVIPTLVMVSNPSIQFMVYETLRTKLTATRPANKAGVKYVSATETFGIGAIAKLVATVITYPLLVIKARLQAKQEIGSSADQRYTGTLDAIAKMLRTEGPGAFYKGLHLKIFQSVFASAILFMTKEELVKFARFALRQRQKMQKKLSMTALA